MHYKSERKFRIAARTWFLLVVGWASAIGSLAADECELPTLTGEWLLPTSRSEDFRITLNPPDYGSTDAVRHHFIFSSVWGSALESEIKARSQGACELHIVRDTFPDLRATLLGYRSAKGQDDFFGAVCIPLLEDAVHNWTLEEAGIAKAVAELTRWSKWAKGLAFSSRSYPYDFTENVFRSALARIYDEKSVMHALISVDTASYRAFSVDAFLEWIRQQRSRYLGVTRLSLCPSALPRTSTGLPMPLSRKRIPVFPSSATVPVGVVSIPSGERSKDLPTAFDHVVIIADEAPSTATFVFANAMAPYAVAVQKKYCDQRLTFDISDNPARPLLITALIKCQFATILNFDYWILVFCEDCRSAGAAGAFAKLVVNDADLRAVKSSETGMRSKGPYPVSFAASGK